MSGIIIIFKFDVSQKKKAFQLSKLVICELWSVWSVLDSYTFRLTSIFSSVETYF